jgi:hypothetical protein
MARAPQNPVVQRNLWIIVFMMLENTPMESNYRAYLFRLLFSILKIMTSVFPCRYWNPKRVMWMEYQSQSQWNEVYQGRYLNNQPTML